MTECGFIICQEKATKKLKLSYGTYEFCEEHYRRFADLIQEDKKNMRRKRETQK